MDTRSEPSRQAATQSPATNQPAVGVAVVDSAAIGSEDVGPAGARPVSGSSTEPEAGFSAHANRDRLSLDPMRTTDRYRLVQPGDNRF